MELFKSSKTIIKRHASLSDKSHKKGKVKKKKSKKRHETESGNGKEDDKGTSSPECDNSDVEPAEPNNALRNREKVAALAQSQAIPSPHVKRRSSQSKITQSSFSLEPQAIGYSLEKLSVSSSNIATTAAVVTSVPTKATKSVAQFASASFLETVPRLDTGHQSKQAFERLESVDNVPKLAYESKLKHVKSCSKVKESLSQTSIASSKSSKSSNSSTSNTRLRSRPNVLIDTQSLRWENECSNSDEEIERLKEYKLNRRKRYLAAANKKYSVWLKSLQEVDVGNSLDYKQSKAGNGHRLELDSESLMPGIAVKKRPYNSQPQVVS